MHFFSSRFLLLQKIIVILYLYLQWNGPTVGWSVSKRPAQRAGLSGLLSPRNPARMSGRRRSADGDSTPFGGADPDAVGEIQDEDLPIPDLLSARAD
jgi:hypothetical protein